MAAVTYKRPVVLEHGTVSMRRGTSQQWANADPILSLYEPGLDLDLNNFKVGDGVHKWSQLPWIGTADTHRLVSITDTQITGLGSIPVTLDKPPTSDYDVVVVYQTRNGTAIAGTDYVAASGYLTFKPGQSVKNISVTALPGGDGYFYIDMVDLGGAHALNTTATVTIGQVGISISDGVLGSVLISIADGVLGNILISIEDGILSDVDQLTISPSMLTYGPQLINTESGAQTVTISNSTESEVELIDITINEDWIYTTTCGYTLSPNSTCSIDAKFKPTTAGPKSGLLSIESSLGTNSVSLSGTATSDQLTTLSTSGSSFVDEYMNTVRLKSVNWFGAEGTNYTPHGTWVRNYKEILDQIQDLGFNCVRIPFSGDFTASNRQVAQFAIDYEANPELIGLSALEVMDKIVDYCNDLHIYVVFDHHRRQAGDGADGSPISGSYTMDSWKASWNTMATRYKDKVNVVGADIHNEPHDLTWGTWASYAEEMGDYIHSIAPNWIIFVEGVGNIDSDFYWWGGQLAGVRTRPVVLQQPNKLAYSPHEYGQSVGNQSWLAYDSQTPPSNWPNNLYQVWVDHWSFIYYENIAPVWIGEFGGFFGVDGSGDNTKPHGSYEGQWVTELGKHVNGSIDGVSPNSGSGMSFAYWAINPNSGDTGGLLQDDWITIQTVKTNLIAPMVNGSSD